MASQPNRFIHSWGWLRRHMLARCDAGNQLEDHIKACIAPFMGMSNREEAEKYVDDIGMRDPATGEKQIHTFDDPAAGLPPGY